MTGFETIPTDLHGHSFFSDGRGSPEEYVARRVDAGLEVIALSDHDTFAGVRRAAEAADQAGMVLVPAMEATAMVAFGTDEAEQIHVLAYYPPSFLENRRLERTAMAKRAEVLHRRWRDLVLDWLSGLPPHEHVALDPDGGLVGRQGADFPGLQSMINLIAERNRPMFDSFWRRHVDFWKDEELFGWSPEELIDVIRADGALDVVAHSARYRDRERTREILDYASGVEVYTSRHSADAARELREYAEANGKYWTASSDDHQHGEYSRPPEGTPRHTVERIAAGANPPRRDRPSAP
jgi:predicted metal-dependent phosphoesterase TrpH